MKSIRRCQRVITLFIMLFLIGMAVLVVRIDRDAPFYMMHSEDHELGIVYDRSGDVLFDGTGTGEYEENHFLDVGNLIGDDKGQMENTLIAQNIDLLNNYSFSEGLIREGGKAAIYTTLDHYANRAVYNAYAGADGCACAYNYKTGELLVCASVPSIDVTKGYGNIAEMKSGTLISKAMYGTVPGSTQKIPTLITALELMGTEKLFSKSYSCSGKYVNAYGDEIVCHYSSGHGMQNIQQAIENSCNPFFAQLVADPDMPLEGIKRIYRTLGYSVNDDEPQYIDINGIQCETASTVLTDTDEFNTQWGCIGQGETLVSPVQMMMWESAIANGTGKMTMPYLIDRASDTYGDVSVLGSTRFSKQLFSEDTASAVRQILLTNGADHYAVSVPGYTLAVKSGTAQVLEGAEENALLTGFIVDDRHPIAFCVLLENKYGTPVTAEQILKTMLDSLCS
ncbi:MAG: ABC transporter permease [Ruminococcus sp.]|nr:ABC transporter permease [Ruminococcus sp.]